MAYGRKRDRKPVQVSPPARMSDSSDAFETTPEEFDEEILSFGDDPIVEESKPELKSKTAAVKKSPARLTSKSKEKVKAKPKKKESREETGSGIEVVNITCTSEERGLWKKALSKAGRQEGKRLVTQVFLLDLMVDFTKESFIPKPENCPSGTPERGVLVAIRKDQEKLDIITNFCEDADMLGARHIASRIKVARYVMKRFVDQTLTDSEKRLPKFTFEK